MAIQDDFSVAQNGDIRYTGSTTNYSVIEFHRWLQDLADNAVAVTSGNDLLDITDNTPSNRQTDNIVELLNGYNIDDTASQHLYDGSIIQASGDEIYDGLVVIAGAGMYLDIIQNGAIVSTNFWTTGLNADSANGISHRFMIKVRTGGVDIDGRRLIGITREWGKTNSEFKINGTSRGNNVMALTYADDLNNTTDVATVGGWTAIANASEGYVGIDVDNNTTPEYYYSNWTKAGFTINQFYERMKWLTRRGSSSTIYGLNGNLFRGITHEVDITSPTGTFSAVETLAYGSGATAGTAKMLAINSPTAGTKLWIQLLTGVAPSNTVTVTGTASAATAVVNGTPTERTLSFPFCGVSTGAAIIGGYGFGITSTSLTASDKLFDLTNSPITPPNYVNFTVGGLVSTEDRVLVGPESGGTLQLNQYTLSAALTTTGITSVTVSSAIATDTPSSGTIRVADNNGVYRRLHYSSYTGAIFTVDTVDGNEDFSSVNASANNNVFISYIDKVATSTEETFTSVYLAPRSLFIRVRDGGGTPIKTFETTGSLGSGGGSATAIRTSDA